MTDLHRFMFKKHPYAFNIDVVLCIEATAGMNPVIEELKAGIASLYARLTECLQERGNTVQELRVRVIAFRDYANDDEPMRESPFFSLPEQYSELREFIADLHAEDGGDCPKNALEALALAMRSEWTTSGERRRHIIMIFTDDPALPLGERACFPGYPEGIPATLDGLRAWWEGKEPIPDGTYQPKVGRLCAFSPLVPPWPDIQAWNWCWFVRCSFGRDGLIDFDFETVSNLLPYIV